MQSELRAPSGPPNEPTADPGSDISVLAGVPDGLRLGAQIFPLKRWMARRQAVVGAEIAVTASLLDHLPTSPSVVVVVAPDIAADAVVEPLLQAAHGMLELREHAAAVTVGVASPAPAPPGSAGALSMYNQHVDALPEALVEAVAAGRRCGLTTPQGNCVLLLQRFVSAIASAVVHASPDHAVPVRIDGRWGLTEVSSAADTFEVPADGVTVREKLAWKPTAHLIACGGTHTVNLPVSWRYRYSIGRGTVRQLAALSRNAAVVAGQPLSLDIALTARGPVLLRCRPNTG